MKNYNSQISSLMNLALCALSDWKPIAFDAMKTQNEPFFGLGPLVEGNTYAFRGKAKNSAGYGGYSKILDCGGGVMRSKNHMLLILLAMICMLFIGCEDEEDDTLPDSDTATEFETPAVIIKFYNGINDEDDVRQALDNIASHCIPTVIISARGDDVPGHSGHAYYDSDVIIHKDPPYLFERAVEYAKILGLKVFAWIPLCQDEAMISENPSYAACQLVSGRPVPSDNLMCPGNPDVQVYISQIVEEVSSINGVDGIFLDWIRYDNWDFCCCDHCQEEYEEEYHSDLLVDMESYSPTSNVQRFREKQVAELVKVACNSTNLPVGAFVIVRGNILGTIHYGYEVAQNYQMFVENGISYISPMVYPEWFTTDYERFAAVSGCLTEIESDKLYPVFGDNPDGNLIPPLDEYDYIHDYILPLCSGEIYYSHDDKMTNSFGEYYLEQIKRIHDFSCGEEVPPPDLRGTWKGYMLSGVKSNIYYTVIITQQNDNFFDAQTYSVDVEQPDHYAIALARGEFDKNNYSVSFYEFEIIEQVGSWVVCSYGMIANDLWNIMEGTYTSASGTGSCRLEKQE